MPVKELKLDFRPMIKRFEAFTRKSTLAELTGGYVTMIKGRGLEFEGFRTYTINDDASQIDWKATLRAQEILVKKYVEERNLNVFFLFDVSNSMLFASTDKLKAEYAAELIASLSFAVLQAGDSVGMIMFTDNVMKVVPISMGNRQYYTIVKQLSDPELYGGNYDLAYALKFVNDYVRRNALLVIVSDFIGLHGDWENFLSIGSRKFNVMPIMIRDPHDNTLPAGLSQVVIVDPYSNEQLVIDPKEMGKEYERVVNQMDEVFEQTLKHYHVPLLKLLTNSSFVNPVMSYFKGSGA
jgi:uncharacterized protein (DUF58 family)